MKPVLLSAAAGLVLLLPSEQLQAGPRETKTVNAAVEVVHVAGVLRDGIPRALLWDAPGVAIIPHVVRAGLVVDGEFGRGVLLTRQADGSWSNPIFITLSGGGVGLQAGVEAADVFLVFKTPHSLDRVMKGKGKLVLGGDVAVAAGPVGQDSGAATDARLKAEILSYARSRGLFAGLSLQGGKLGIDHAGNDSFYGLHGGQPTDVLALPGVASVEALKRELAALCAPPPPVIVVPAPPPPPVIVPVVPIPAPPPRRW
jgi:lipid-binding SYLF domain-containing protein